MLSSRSLRVLSVAAISPLALVACSGGQQEGQQEARQQEPLQAPSEPAATQSSTNQGSSPADAVQLELQLASVRPTEVNLDDEREEFVEFCFGASLQSVTDEAGFRLSGLKPSNSVTASSAQLVEDNDRCVLAAFPADTDVTSYTIGVVGNVVVKDRSGEVNLQDSLPLDGGGDTRGSGGTSSPELLRASVDRTLDQIRYVFDERQLDEGSAQPNLFGYYTRDGQAVTGASVESVDDSTVIVGFGGGGGQQVEEAVRFFVESGAVKDSQGMASTPGAAGGATAVPDLVTVKRAGTAGSQYDFRFDEAVQNEMLDKFMLFTTDGEPLAASSVSRPTPEIVRATFSSAADFQGKIARAVVARGAVESLTAQGSASTIGAAALPRAGNGSGPTSGPDLLEVTLDSATGQATYRFDATLMGEDVQADNFFIVSDSGTVTAARDLVDVTGSSDGVTGAEVVLLFDQDQAQAAVLASVNPGAVADQSGEANPTITIGIT